jgi:heterotetrameric sarcosine oxidase gamma subunit
MAASDSLALAPLSGAEVAGLAALWPKSSAAIALRLVEPLHVLSLRHFPGGGASALSTVLAEHRLPGLPGPGHSRGIEPRLIWRSPTETLLLTQDAAQASALLAALRPAPGALACALDLSAGTLVVTLQGGNVEALLSRLVDAHALPRGTDQASRVRLADIAAVVWRGAPDHLGLLVDRANAHYLARWLSYAADAI